MLVGRAEELGALRGMLARGRLVTVVGGAGIGKSLLAEHAAAAVGSAMPDGVVRVRWWDGIPARRRSVAEAVVDAVDGGRERTADGVGVSGSDGVVALTDRLRSRRMLVVLDDFDPVRGECVRVVRALLDGAPDVRILAAGRHPLGLGEEAVLRLGPLGGGVRGGVTDAAEYVGVGAAENADAAAQVDADAACAEHTEHIEHAQHTERTGRADDADSADFAPVTAGPAATLFLTRMRDARRRAGHDTPPRGRPGGSRRTPGDHVDEVRLADDICRRLEGTPLAIELAAAQAAQYSLPQLALMLETAQGWLGVADARLRRHRSLRAAVGAGYALCGSAERTVWARLSVFAGNFDEDAAAYVCSGGGLDAQDVPASLARLVLASVLEPVRDPGGVLSPRYRMSAAVRGFGAERLQSAGETAAAVSRHLYWYGHVASTAHHLWSSGLHEEAAALVRDDEADLRAALAREPSVTDPASTTLAVAVDLWFWWAVCGHAEEGRALLRRLLPLVRSDTRVCGQAMWLAGWLAVCAGSPAPEAAELLGQAWRVAMFAGDDATVGRVSHVLGAMALADGRTERAIAHLRAAADTIPVHAEHGPPAAVSWALLAVAQAEIRPGDARRSIRRASAGPQARHDVWTRSMTQYAQAFVDHFRGRRSRAWRRAHKALAGAVGVGGAASEPAEGNTALHRAAKGTAPQRSGEGPASERAGANPACMQLEEGPAPKQPGESPASRQPGENPASGEGPASGKSSAAERSVVAMTGPPGAALIHQLIADIESGPPPTRSAPQPATVGLEDEPDGTSSRCGSHPPDVPASGPL
ncbi:AAA family ATPase [Streptomyces venezuelae]|uniref:ATP-binding protein n=1 Tax=Streptomyces venezuelae TaxID=54571 RepID=UPI0034373FDA